MLLATGHFICKTITCWAIEKQSIFDIVNKIINICVLVFESFFLLPGKMYSAQCICLKGIFLHLISKSRQNIHIPIIKHAKNYLCSRHINNLRHSCQCYNLYPIISIIYIALIFIFHFVKDAIVYSHLVKWMVFNNILLELEYVGNMWQNGPLAKI